MLIENLDFISKTWGEELDELNLHNSRKCLAIVALGLCSMQPAQLPMVTHQAASLPFTFLGDTPRCCY